METPPSILISIITVCKNSERFLADTITSVIHQTYPNIQYIIADGGSTDGTVELIRKYSGAIDTWFSQPDNGMYDAINKALARAKGDYLLILNSDDLLAEPTTIEKVVYQMGTRRLDYYYGNLIKFKEGKNKKVRMFPVTFTGLLMSTHGTFVPHPCFFISRQIHQQLGGYDESLLYASDYDYILRALQLPNAKGKHINVYVSKFRIHGNSITASGKIEDERKKILTKYGYYNQPYAKRLLYYYSLWIYYKLINLGHPYTPARY